LDEVDCFVGLVLQTSLLHKTMRQVITSQKKDRLRGLFALWQIAASGASINAC
jgi:hypothetical protein